MQPSKIDRLSHLAKAIAELSDDQRAQLAARCPVMTIEGRPLSIYNACFLALQHSSVTVVGGYQQWRKAGRQVRKGETSLLIWIPRSHPKKDDGTDSDERPGFLLGNVFDVSQTDAIDANAPAYQPEPKQKHVPQPDAPSYFSDQFTPM